MDLQGSLFGDEIHEYFVLISPDEVTIKEVEFWKKEFEKYIRFSSVNVKNRPHLSLVKFRRPYQSDQVVMESVASALKTARSFRLSLDGSTVFNHDGSKRTVVLKLKDPDPPKIMARLLRREFKMPATYFTPHITILRSIPVEDYNKIAETQKEIKSRNEFWCDRVTILKKRVLVDTSYESLGEVMLK
ncbi:MAG: 2'-5' RNA ligase family protein [Bacteroidia bacterium]|nr:2'-5' RNA ligase family protein [Bacteroidia bacterium]